MPGSFAEPLYGVPAPGYSIERAVSGNRADAQSYLILEGGCSCSLVTQAHKSRRDFSHLFISGVNQLLETTPAVSFLVHVCRGDWRSEIIQVKSKKVIAEDDLPSLVLRIEEDVRYVIRAGIEY
jgi:hypothetical protein